MVKLPVATLATVPADPPAAGPDRAFDPVPRDPGPPAEPPAVAEGEVAVAEDVPQAESTIAEATSGVTMSHRLRLSKRHRRDRGRRGVSGVGLSGLVGSWSFTMVPLLGAVSREWHPFI
jgi:hypothetical protein